MSTIRFEVNHKHFIKWSARAAELGLSVSQWARMQLLSATAEPDEKPAASVEAPTQEGGSIGSRILAKVSGPRVTVNMVPGLAQVLGVPVRSIYAALGSLVASGKMRKDGGDFYIVEKE
ncbi:MAG: hypothetical protein AB7H90_03320 [Alphaproteobacteria bacterium]